MTQLTNDSLNKLVTNLNIKLDEKDTGCYSRWTVNIQGEPVVQIIERATVVDSYMVYQTQNGIVSYIRFGME